MDSGAVQPVKGKLLCSRIKLVDIELTLAVISTRRVMVTAGASCCRSRFAACQIGLLCVCVGIAPLWALLAKQVCMTSMLDLEVWW